jgi:hypothetical protein
MHRDAKLGLALGILVIGFAAAFCFPRRPDAGSLTRGDSEAQIDQQLLDKSVKLYPVASTNSSPPVPSDPVAFRSSAQDEVVVEVPMTSGREIRFPSQTASSVDGVETRRLALDPMEEELPGEELTEREPEAVTYTVQPGDTLSSIAQRQLGGSGKFGEIFEANRDLLGSADALQIGMVLKIPSPGGRTAVAESPRRDRATRQTAVTPPVADRPPRYTIAQNPEVDLGPSPSTIPGPAADSSPSMGRLPLPTNAIEAAPSPRPTPSPRPRSSSALRGAKSVGASLGGKRSTP